MNIPFRDLFMKVRERVSSGRAKAPAAPAAIPAPLNKTEGDKFAKTVVPNAVRTIAADPTAPERDALPAGGPRIVSFGRAPANPRARDLPPAVALALEPNVERVLSLALTDVLDHIPAGHIKPRESFDVSRRVLLKASEVEKGMAVGRPTVALATLYQQMPEIFMHPVPAADSAVVSLPFEKVIGELSNLHMRNDQQTEIVPQVETPFLQVTIEDNEKFGTRMEPITITEMPAVRVELATAQALAAAQPEAMATEKFVPSQPRRIAPEVSDEKAEESVPEARSAATSIPEARARIPFPPADTAPASSNGTTLSPNGTGEPAQTRVPASGGPPVPTSAPVAPTRIPFKLSVPTALGETPAATSALGLGALGAEPTLLPATESVMAVAQDQAANAGPVVTLSLLPILRSLPPMQAKQDPTDISADAKISFPMALVAPQLASGKVVIQPRDFHQALTPEFQKYFDAAAVDAPVQLSLPDVLSNLPGDALRMRDDQEVIKQDEVFETPFSAKAAEDAARFSSPASPAAETKLEAATPAVITKPGVKTPAEPEKASTPEVKMPTVEAPKAEETAAKFEAKDAITKACALTGVASCSLIFADGLSIAGNIPSEMGMEGVSAVAPTLLKKIEKHMLDTQLGGLTCITIHGEKSPVSLFLRGNVCLTAVHNGAEIDATSRQELARMTEELSHTYTQPETAHVDH